MIYDQLVKKEKKLALIGLGYVGLPIALAFARKISVIGFDINRLIAEIVAELRARGFQVGGVLQKGECDDDPSRGRLTVVDIRTGESACITQERGRDAHAPS